MGRRLKAGVSGQSLCFLIHNDVLHPVTSTPPLRLQLDYTDILNHKGSSEIQYFFKDIFCLAHCCSEQLWYSVTKEDEETH